MKKSSRHPLITLFVVFAFLAQASGLSGCADAEKAYKEATGQTVVDDSKVRSKLETINQMSDNAANQAIAMMEAVQAAQAKGDAGDVLGMADIWVDQVGPNADLLLSTIEQIEAAEKVINEQTSAARTGGEHPSVEVAPAVAYAGYVLGLAALGWGFKQISNMVSGERKVVATSAPGSQEEKNAIANIKNGGLQAIELLAKTVVKFGTKTISSTAGAIWTVYDMAKKVLAGKPKAIGGTKECASAANQRIGQNGGVNLLSSGCKIYIGEATTSGSSHTFDGLPDGNWDMMVFQSALARTLLKSWATTGVPITVQKAFIAIADATAKNVKASDAGTYTAPSDGGSSGGDGGGASASFPREYSGSGPFTWGDCSTTINWNVTLLADGTVSGTSTPTSGCGDSGGDVITHSGTHSGGSFIMSATNSVGETTSGIFDENSMTGSGSGGGANWSFTLTRK
ncbi:MAG: hypothetical protein HQK86_09680 [Nitrospinae bacterium]|nr:hypothetical protein [Nitrospinota bacterium]